LPRRLEKPDLDRIRETTTAACIEQRRELYLSLEIQTRQIEKGGWELEPTLEEESWDM
jgi:hypothetical protein